MNPAAPLLHPTDTPAARRCDPCGTVRPRVTLAARIAALEREIVELRQQQRAELLAAIALVVGTSVKFSAGELFDDPMIAPALRPTFREMGIGSPNQLGKRLRRLWLEAGHAPGVLRVVRAKTDYDGAPCWRLVCA